MKSELKDQKACFLCGSSNRSMMGYFRQFDGVGIISINDWYILNLGVEEREDNLRDSEERYSFVCYGNTGEISYGVEGNIPRGEVSAQITLPERCQLKTKIIHENLC